MRNDSKISNQRKKELEQPDPFLESLYKGVEAAKQYKKQLILASGVLFAIICIVSGTMYMIRSSEVKASEMLAKAMERYGALEPAEGYVAAKPQLDALLEAYPNTASGRLAIIRLGEICYAAEKYDEAYALYTAALDEYKKDPVVRELLLFSLGHTCQALQKNEEAIRHFSALANNEEAFMKRDAQFQLGMIALNHGDRAKGLAWMEKLTTQEGASLYKTMADTILAQN